MINSETIRFIAMLDELCTGTARQYRTISELIDSGVYFPCIYFDDNKSFYNSYTNETFYEVKNVFEYEGGVFMGEWSDFLKTDSKVSVLACFSDTDDPCVKNFCDDLEVYIQDGDYFVTFPEPETEPLEGVFPENLEGETENFENFS